MSKYNEVMDKVKVTDDMKKRILQNIENAEDSNVTSFEEVKKKKENKIVPIIKRYGAVAAMFAVVLVGAYAVFGNVAKHEMESSAPAGSYEMAESTTMTESATESAMEVAETDEAVMEEAEEDAMEAPATPAVGNDNAMYEAQSAPIKDVSGSKAESVAVNSKILEFASAKELSAEAGEEIKDIESLLRKSSENHYILYDNGMMEIDYFIDGGNIYYRKSTEEAATEYANSGRSGEYIDYSRTVKKTIAGTEVTLKGTEDTYNVAGWTKDGWVYSFIHQKGLDDAAMTTVLGEIIEQ